MNLYDKMILHTPKFVENDSHERTTQTVATYVVLDESLSDTLLLLHHLLLRCLFVAAHRKRNKELETIGPLKEFQVLTAQHALSSLRQVLVEQMRWMDAEMLKRVFVPQLLYGPFLALVEISQKDDQPDTPLPR